MTDLSKQSKYRMDHDYQKAFYPVMFSHCHPESYQHESFLTKLSIFSFWSRRKHAFQADYVLCFDSFAYQSIFGKTEFVMLV